MLEVYAKSEIRGLRNADSSFIAVHEGESRLPAIFGSFQITASASRILSSKLQEQSMCSYIDWKPDFDLMSNDNIQTYCASGTSNVTSKATSDLDIRKKKALICYAAFKKLENWKLSPTVLDRYPHLEKYLGWVQSQSALLGIDDNLREEKELQKLLDDEKSFQELLNEVECFNKEGELMVRVSKDLERILSGEVDALDLLFHDDLLTEYYQENHRECSGFIAALQYVDAFCHKHHDIKILEIGAGTGGATESILSALSPGSSDFPRFSEYVFTDISAKFFESARERFSSHKDRMKFKTLDIGLDPLEQGFQEKEYDIIVASDVGPIFQVS